MLQQIPDPPHAIQQVIVCRKHLGAAAIAYLTFLKMFAESSRGIAVQLACVEPQKIVVRKTRPWKLHCRLQLDPNTTTGRLGQVKTGHIQHTSHACQARIRTRKGNVSSKFHARTGREAGYLWSKKQKSSGRNSEWRGTPAVRRSLDAAGNKEPRHGR